jgi:uncharacterized protein YjbI with pentapeptide repeats
MNCPECDVKGYSRKTKTPEWRCRKCGHEWDVPQTNCSVALANFEVTDRLSTIPPIVEEFLYSIRKNEGDIRDITLEFAFENLQRNYDEAELLQILGKDDWSELESGDLGGYMHNLSVVFRNDGCLIVAEHILKENIPTGLNLGDVLEVKHFSDDNYALIRIIERGDLVLRYLTVDERDEISGYRRSTAVEEERKEKERQTAADLERTERQAAADLKRSQSEGKLLDNGAEKRGFPEGLLAAVQIGSIGGVIAVVVGILFITGVFSGDETTEARFTPSPIVGKDVERLLAEIETFTNAFGQSFGPFVVTGNAECLDCDLRGADLKYALMAWFDLSGSDFSGADLYFASFSGANLSGANFSGANLKYAGFKNANLSGANLDNVFDAQGIGEAYRSTIPNKYRYDPKKENWVSKD